MFYPQSNFNFWAAETDLENAHTPKTIKGPSLKIGRIRNTQHKKTELQLNKQKGGKLKKRMVKRK